MAPYKTIIIDKSLVSVDPRETPEEKPARTLLHEYMKIAERYMDDDRKHVRNKITALGSREYVSSNGNYGFFSAVMECYNNHWVLDMRPDDWFYTFVQKIALAIDKQAKTEEVRKFFVDHEGKKTLTVLVPPLGGPLGVDYSWFLDQMTEKIQENIKTPNYVELMTSNFSTSTKTDRIVTSINTMYSIQEFFEFCMVPGCGLPAVTMRGTEDDWKCLVQKIEKLEELLQPIKDILSPHLTPNWWDNIKTICKKLLETYQGSPDLTWWSSIIIKTEVEQRWGSGTKRYQALDGWFTTDILGLHEKKLSKIKNPLVSVPMTIDWAPYPVEEAAFIAGIVGYVVEKDDNLAWPRVSAVHSWSLLLQPSSPFLKDMKDWEDKMIGA